MPTRKARWLAVLLSLGLMAGIATYFQLSLPRLRTEWIGNAVAQHNLVIAGQAGSPWQYRLLSEYLVEGIFRLLLAVHGFSQYVYGLYGFVVFRGAQDLCIFGLGFAYFRKLGLGLISSLVGLGVVCAAMLLGQLQTNWRSDTYTEVVLYLLAAMCVLMRRISLVVPVAVLAAFNRETGVLIPFMPLALIDAHALGSPQNRGVYRTVGAGIALFVLVRVVLFFVLPSQDGSMRVVTDELVGNLKPEGGFVLLALALGVLPLVSALGLRTCSPFLRYLFWLIVPAWIVTHSSGNLPRTPIPYLVPLVLVFVPIALFTAAALWSSSGGFVGSAVKDILAPNRETLAALAVVYLLGPVVAGGIRLWYPFPLERFEGPVLQEVRRVALGQPLYVAPSLDFVPLLYGPVYVYLSAGVALLTGVSLLPLRIVSFGAALGSAVLVYVLVSRDAPGRLAGFLAAGLFVGTTQLTPTDRFPARVDSLCLLLVLAAVFAARRADLEPEAAPRLSIVCGVLVALAILTKQTAAVMAVPLLILAAPRVHARLVPYLIGAAAAQAAAALALFAAFGGWAGFYLAELPRNHGVDWPMLAAFWTNYLLPHFWFVVLFAAAFFPIRLRRGDYGVVWFYAVVTAGLIGMSWVSILNPGGRTNSMPPAYAGLAILFGLGFQASLDFTRARFPLSRILPLGLLSVAALALATLELSEDQPAPLRANALAGQRLVTAIAALPGAVFAPDLGEFQLRAGKGEDAFSASWQELLGSYGGSTLPAGRQWLSDLDRALSSGQYAYVLLDPEGFDPALQEIVVSHGYEKIGPLLQKNDPFFLWRLGFSSGGGYLTPSPDVYALPPGPP